MDLDQRATLTGTTDTLPNKIPLRSAGCLSLNEFVVNHLCSEVRAEERNPSCVRFDEVALNQRPVILHHLNGMRQRVLKHVVSDATVQRLTVELPLM